MKTHWNWGYPHFQTNPYSVNSLYIVCIVCENWPIHKMSGDIPAPRSLARPHADLHHSVYIMFKVGKVLKRMTPHFLMSANVMLHHSSACGRKSQLLYLKLQALSPSPSSPSSPCSHLFLQPVFQVGIKQLKRLFITGPQLAKAMIKMVKFPLNMGIFQSYVMLCWMTRGLCSYDLLIDNFKVFPWNTGKWVNTAPFSHEPIRHRCHASTM